MDTQTLPDHILCDFAPFIDLRHKETKQVKRFSKVSLSDYFDIRYALSTDYIRDDEMSNEDNDNG